MDRKLRYQDASTKLGVPVATLYAMVSRKQIPHIRLGGRLVVFSEAELDRWLESHSVGVRAAVKAVMP